MPSYKSNVVIERAAISARQTGKTLANKYAFDILAERLRDSHGDNFSFSSISPFGTASHISELYPRINLDYMYENSAAIRNHISNARFSLKMFKNSSVFQTMLKCWLRYTIDMNRFVDSLIAKEEVSRYNESLSPIGNFINQAKAKFGFRDDYYTPINVGTLSSYDESKYEFVYGIPQPRNTFPFEIFDYYLDNRNTGLDTLNVFSEEFYWLIIYPS